VNLTSDFAERERWRFRFLRARRVTPCTTLGRPLVSPKCGGCQVPANPGHRMGLAAPALPVEAPIKYSMSHDTRTRGTSCDT
jgi:hypothetical protein